MAAPRQHQLRWKNKDSSHWAYKRPLVRKPAYYIYVSHGHLFSLVWSYAPAYNQTVLFFGENANGGGGCSWVDHSQADSGSSISCFSESKIPSAIFSWYNSHINSMHFIRSLNAGINKAEETTAAFKLQSQGIRRLPSLCELGTRSTAVGSLCLDPQSLVRYFHTNKAPFLAPCC